MENAVIYARYSSANQTENSIEAQVNAALSFAKSHKYNVIKTYADRAKTGTNDNREAFQQMLSDTESHNFTIIIVWKVDRFGRNREEIALNKYRCKKNGVRIEYVAENITTGPEGVILESVLEGFAEYYSKQLSQNSKRGIANIIKKGQYSGGNVPLGYKVVDKRYIIDPEGAKKIQSVFRMYNSGYSFVEIADALDLKDFNIRNYIKNESYCTGNLIRAGYTIPNAFEPIIDKNTFDQANNKLSHHIRRRKPLDYLLSGKVICSNCGKRFVGYAQSTKYNKKYAYYRCKCNCIGHSVNIKTVPLEQDVLKQIRSILLSEESIDSLTDAVYEKLKLKIKNINGQQSKETLERRKQNLLDAVESGTIELSEVRERLININKELSNLTTVTLPSKSEIKKFILEMKNLKEDRALINALVENVIVDPFTRKYTIKFCPSQFSLK